MFCPSCGSMMFPIAKEKKYVCNKCGAEKLFGDKGEVAVTESNNKTMKVIGDETATLPKTRIPCPECEHSEAFYVIRQTRAADEPETRIYRCCKCNHTWREY